ncbi:hypothetical protein Tco_1198830 [Tanacetum coccineum]
MNKKKSANKNTTNYRLYHALMEALIADEDAMDKEVADKVKDHKRKHDRSLRHLLQTTSPPLSSTDGRSYTERQGVDSSMHISDPESEHSEQSSDDISKQDEGNDSDMEDTDNAHIPKVSTTTWFKPIPESERPATPEPEFGPFPQMISRNQNITGQNAIPTTFKVPGGKQLQGRLDLSNPEGHQILRNIYEPLPLGGPPGQVTIQPQFFFNKDLDYLLTGDKERKIALSISKLKAARYLDFGLEELVPSLWVESEREYDISAVYGITQLWFRGRNSISTNTVSPLIVKQSDRRCEFSVSVPSQYSRKAQPSAQDRQDQSSHSSQHVDKKPGDQESLGDLQLG